MNVMSNFPIQTIQLLINSLSLSLLPTLPFKSDFFFLFFYFYFLTYRRPYTRSMGVPFPVLKS